MPQENLSRIDLWRVCSKAFDLGVQLQREDARADGVPGTQRDPDVARSTVGVAVSDRHHESHGEHTVTVLF